MARLFFTITITGLIVLTLLLVFHSGYRVFFFQRILRKKRLKDSNQAALAEERQIVQDMLYEHRTQEVRDGGRRGSATGRRNGDH